MTRSTQVSPRLRLQSLAMAIAIALPAASAMAQEADATAKKDEAAQPATLGVVNVTAERRVEDIQQVPISITTVSGEKLDVIRSGGEDVQVPVRQAAQPADRILVRPCVPALLHPRPGQYRFRSERLAAGVAGV